MLRDYQQRAIDQLYTWFSDGNVGNPCLVLPTGAGKSHIISALCKDALQKWPDTRVLMLTHVKELIEQNAEKMRLHWPGAPMGIYSASIGKKQLGEPITFAGIQSVRTKISALGHIDLVIVDECHLISHKDEGGYRTLIASLMAINPALRVIGLTATPYRLGHGLITDKPALFDDLLEPVSIEELIYKGHLATLRSKHTNAKLDITGVHKRGGEFIASELQSAVDTDSKNDAAALEIINMGKDRKAWLVFCAGVKHARHMADALLQHGVSAACVTGDMPKSERERILAEFKSGKIKALTNANVLTTGFDHPGIDLIAMLRPTMSASLYVQMAGRGMRPADGKKDCLVLDFAGVVSTHGPITAVQPPKKSSDKGSGEAPVKTCEQCSEIVNARARTCPACGAIFPAKEDKPLTLHDDDIMGLAGLTMAVTSWEWRKHVSRASGKEMLACTYSGGLSDKPITEYFPILHDGYPGQKALRFVLSIAQSAGTSLSGLLSTAANDELLNAARLLNRGIPPISIEYRRDGKFHRILRRTWACKEGQMSQNSSSNGGNLSDLLRQSAVIHATTLPLKGRA